MEFHVDAQTMGALFMFFETATAFTGFLLGIDPFDQPGVELGKQITFGRMGRAGFEHMARHLTSNEALVIEI